MSAMRRYSSKLSSKAQIFVPKNIREHLKLRLGDTIRYRITAGGVLIEKDRSGDKADPFAIFTEWGSAEDDLSFADL